MLNTSGCAFSISSSRSTAYGRRRIASVSCPPSSNPMQLGELLLRGGDIALDLRGSAVLELRGLRVVGRALGALDLSPQVVEPLALLADLADRGLLLLPVRAQTLR